jgi:hypothetical protein
VKHPPGARIVFWPAPAIALLWLMIELLPLAAYAVAPNDWLLHPVTPKDWLDQPRSLGEGAFTCASVAATGLVTLLWPFGLHFYATSLGPQPARGQKIARFAVGAFIVMIVGWSAVPVFGLGPVAVEYSWLHVTLEAALSVTLIASVVSMFATMWVAAGALVRFEKGLGASADGGGEFLTLLAIAYLPIGIWFLEWRLRRLENSLVAREPIS